MERVKLKFSNKYKLFAAGSIAFTVLAYLLIFGSKNVEPLIYHLEKGDKPAKLRSLDELASLGSGAEDAFLAVSRASRSPDGELRAAAIEALINIDSRGAAVELKNMLSDRDSGVRMDAHEALERLGTPHARAILDKVQVSSTRQAKNQAFGEWAGGIRDTLRRQQKKKDRLHKKIYDHGAKIE